MMSHKRGPVQLIEGKILGLVEGDRARFEVRAGRWQNVVTGAVRPCAVLVQYRSWEGELSRPFRVVFEVNEVPAVVEGLRRWSAECLAGQLEGAFSDA